MSRRLHRLAKKNRKLFSFIIASFVVIFVVGIALLRMSIAQASGLDPMTVHNLVNNQRTSVGLSPLEFNPSLAQAASVKAQDMAQAQYFAHYRPSDNKRGLTFITDQGYFYTQAGENLAIYFDTEGEMVTAWMDSPTHRKNVLNGGYSQTGIGIATGSYNGFVTQYVVQFFAAPQATQTPAPVQQQQPVQVQPAQSSSSQSAEPTPTPDPIQQSSSNSNTSSSSVSSTPQPPTQPKSEQLSAEEIEELIRVIRRAFSESDSQSSSTP